MFFTIEVKRQCHIAGILYFNFITSSFATNCFLEITGIPGRNEYIRLLQVDEIEFKLEQKSFHAFINSQLRAWLYE